MAELAHHSATWSCAGPSALHFSWSGSWRWQHLSPWSRCTYPRTVPGLEYTSTHAMNIYAYYKKPEQSIVLLELRKYGKDLRLLRLYGKRLKYCIIQPINNGTIVLRLGSQSVCVLLVIRLHSVQPLHGFLSFLYSHFIIPRFQTMCSEGCGMS